MSEISTNAWYSGVMRDYRIGYKQGLRAKFYGEDWEPPQHIVRNVSKIVYDNMERHIQGYTLTKDQLPEAIAIFDRKRFGRIGDIFVAGRTYAIKGRLADVLSEFDFGEGGLVSFEIYDEDLVTPVSGKFYYLNFGARKNSILTEESRNIKFITINKNTDVEIWKINAWAEDYDVVLSEKALEGADIWIEEKISNTIFLSNALVVALRRAKIETDLMLTQARVTTLTR